MSIKYCVWDVGQVIYPYTLAYLDDWALAQTADKQAFQNRGGVKSFDYNPYMSGKISNEKFCQNICEEFDIPFNKRNLLEIKRALYKGVGPFYAETLETMEMLSARGIENCILSNALPMLKETAPQQVPEKYRFASFELKLLKPDVEIYKEVRRRLGCNFEEMVFVDDKQRNVQAAASLGIRGIVFNKNSIKSDCESVIKQAERTKGSAELKIGLNSLDCLR